MSERISIAALREEADEMLAVSATAWLDPRDLRALVEAVEAAQRYLTASEAEAEAAGGIEGIEQNALNKLARFDFEAPA